MSKQTKIIPLLFGLALILSACAGSSTTQVTTGSIFRSDNSGLAWGQKSSILGVAKAGSFNSANVNTIEVDPNDSKAIYTGTSDFGLFWSLDSGESWQWSKALGRVNVRSIAVAPVYKCTIFAAVENKLYKSIDCARTWNQAYYDNDPLVAITSVITDPKDGSKVYMSTSRGEVIKSSDWGTSWRTINRFDSKVSRLFINPNNGDYLYAATIKDGLNVSISGGETWETVKQALAKFSVSEVKDLAFSVKETSHLYITTKYGILKTEDNGKTWQDLQLLTPEQKATINALAIDPKNNDKIYYCTNTTFYASNDGGKNWTSKKLPSARVCGNLLIDPANTNTIFMGAYALKQ
jgi:photosystem II stability/assembly factor-like uncharacterized protein